MSRSIKGRGGRPVKQPDEKRCLQINLRVTIAEHDDIAAESAKANLSVSDFIRRSALNQRVIVPKSVADAALIREINAIGNNVNQISRAANRGQDERDYWRAIGDKIAQALDEVIRRAA